MAESDLSAEVNGVTVLPAPSGRLFDGFESGNVDGWDVVDTNEWEIRTDNVRSGTYSAGAETANSLYLLATRDIDEEIRQVTIYFLETGSSFGGAYSLRNANGERITAWGTANPQWIYVDGGSRAVGDADGAEYSTWVRTTVTLDDSSETATIEFEGGGNSGTYTAAYENSGPATEIGIVNISTASGLASKNGGGAYVHWTDDITVVTEGGPIPTVGGGDVDLLWTNNDDSSDGGIDVERAQPPEWSYRKPITIDSTKVDADLTDFPVTVHLDSDNDLAAHAQSSGDDIRFEDSNGNQLSHEIESYDSSTGTLWAHVKVPSLSASSDTTIYVYYGNDSASNQESVTDVWDSDYGAVWHFNDATGDLTDSTGNGNSGSVPSAVERVLDTEYGPAYGFSDEVIDVSNISSELNFTETFTITLVVEIEQQQRYPRFISRGGSNEEFDLLQWTDDFSFRFNGNTDARDLYHISTTPSWHVVSFTYDYPNDTIKAIDGSGTTVNSASGLVQLNTGANAYNIGAVNDGWNAKLSRVEISQTARSGAWVAAENRNKNDALSFYTVGSEEQPKSWTTVVSDLSPSTTQYTDTSATGGTIYQYRVVRSTDHATATSGTSEPLRVPKRLTRTATCTADGAVEASRSAMSKTRTATMTGDGTADATREPLSKTRTAICTSDGAVDAIREPMSKTRTATCTGDGAVHTIAEFSEALGERLNGIYIDYDPELAAFVTEWYDETPVDERQDLMALRFTSQVESPLRFAIESDVDGDGNPEHRSEWLEFDQGQVPRVYHSVPRDAKQYRVLMRGLRKQDVLRSIDSAFVYD